MSAGYIIASNTYGRRSTFGKRISEAAFISMRGPRLGAGAAPEALWSRGGECVKSCAACSVTGAGSGVGMRAVEVQGRTPVIPGDRGRVWEETLESR